MFHPKVRGTYYEMGHNYGTVLYKHGFRVPAQDSERLDFRRKSEKEVRRVFPEILEEIRAFADACHASYEHLAALILGVGAFKPGSACSVFATFDGSELLFGRNYDFYYKFKEHNESYLTEPSDGYFSIGNTDIFAGREDGVNEKGLAVAITAVMPTEVEPGINFALLTRYILDKCATVGEATKVLRCVHHVTTNNFLLADKEGYMIVVEASPRRVRIRKPEPDSNFIVCTNHFLHSDMLELENQSERPSDSVLRFTSISESLQKLCGKVSLKGAQKILSNHDGMVCSHIEEIELGTLWSVVATLSKPSIYLAEGHPCKTKFKLDTRLNRAVQARR